MVASNAVRFFFCISNEPSAQPNRPVVPEIISKASPAGCFGVVDGHHADTVFVCKLLSFPTIS